VKVLRSLAATIKPPCLVERLSFERTSFSQQGRGVDVVADSLAVEYVAARCGSCRRWTLRREGKTTSRSEARLARFDLRESLTARSDIVEGRPDSQCERCSAGCSRSSSAESFGRRRLTTCGNCAKPPTAFRALAQRKQGGEIRPFLFLMRSTWMGTC